ncbi:riboflavin biosynthesis protein RibD [Mesorhizobium sp. L-8-10]|uniref:dihydrofolate reductase family protein n=1 Tax=unclassified Mesorhizobium TaxID=325217 RepID=UPI0019286448|nr:MULTISPECIES: dihydrofolate reductase family protein [unclassified Mesorhizobium]BCH23873.1 riboflavin biosynthesis protein RibD [Mesorhizobium sp. L-8-3]BCH31609.1 riboflavin biosynthesis protein RibD [Mesorhizobium sp. L-8-10]
MARLIVWNLVTVDGYFEGAKKWDLDFHNLAWGPELEKLSEEFGDNAAALVFGRVTYEGMANYWRSAEPGKVATYMNALPKLVASRTLTSVDWNNSRVTADIVPELKRLKAELTKELYVFGSADLTHSLLEAGLVDELMICVVPVLLGEGTLLFKPGRKTGLDLTETRRLGNGAIINSYAVKQAD